MPPLRSCSMAALLTLATGLTASAQAPQPAVRSSTGQLSAAASVSPHATTNPERPVLPALRPYLGCKLPLGPDMTGRTLLPQAPMARTAQTFSGPKKIQLVDGLMAAFAFPNEQPFANVKVELLPAATYTAEKTDLISEFDKINATGSDTQRNYAMKPVLNGFEVEGFDRTALDGKVLGIYLLFDNPHHVATTVYFLNAPVGQRKFDSLNEYTALREGFLNAYTVCVRRALGGTPAPARKPGAATKASAKTAPRTR